MELQKIFLTPLDNLRADVIIVLLSNYIPPQSLEEQWDIPGLEQQLEHDFGLSYH